MVFQIGQRLDERVPGSGLGLPIVRDLAQLYGGEVRLEDSARGGLRAVLRLACVG
jgi:signal transduction histidine kinase